MYHQFFPEIIRLSRDQFANFLLQRLIENLRVDLVDSLAEKVKNDCLAMATNQCSCRVLQSVINFKYFCDFAFKKNCFFLFRKSPSCEHFNSDLRY